MQDLVSIIMPVYNCEKYISKAINSVKEQTYSNYELIIINDNSSDNTPNIIKKYKADSKIKIINLQENKGVAKARNEGIKIANGKYIAFLDADDFWDSDKLEAQINFMEDKKIFFSFTGFCYTDENGNPKHNVLNIPKELNYRQALKNTIILTSTVMINIKEIPKKLIYMPNIGSEDTATWWSILKNGFNAYGLKKNLTYYRTGTKSLSKNKFVSIRRTWSLYRKVEKLSICKSVYYFINYIIRAITKRI